MAAHLQSRGLAGLGKRLFSQILSRDSIVTRVLNHMDFAVIDLRRVLLICIRRGVHVSTYDKNPEEHAHSTVVPDDVIPPQPEQYWAPHPRTGVFGPTADQHPASGKEGGLHVGGSAESVLEQKAFFRPLEDLEKPPHP